jgi:AcrR family transcriptional regulator
MRDGNDGNSCETRQAILEAARSRFLHYGYKKTTIDEIAADAGVGKGTVYLYFGGKEDILLTPM